MPMQRTAYADALADLRLQVELLGAKVQASLTQMRAALEDGNRAASAAVIAADDDIDAVNLSLVERCYELLALQAPVASDLRLVVSVIRVTSDLERIADLAIRVAKISAEREVLEANRSAFELLVAMAACAEDALVAAMQAWATGDTTAAAATAGPSAITALHERLIADIVNFRGLDAAHQAVRTAMAAQALDRIADHAAVIAARVRYLVTGDPTHLAAEIR